MRKKLDRLDRRIREVLDEVKSHKGVKPLCSDRS